MFILILFLLDIAVPTTATTTTGLAFSKLSNISSATIPWTNTPAGITYQPKQPAATLTTATFSGTAYDFASSDTATTAIQVLAKTTVSITLSATLKNPILLYCFKWPPGVYVFRNSAGFKSKNTAATIQPDGVMSILTVPAGVNLNGIIQFPLTGSKVLSWNSSVTKNVKLIFAIGQRIYCDKPLNVDKNLVAGTCGGTYNSACTYTCKAGFIARTYTSQKCTVSGTYNFSSTLTTACTAITCTPPTVDSSLVPQTGTCGGSYNSVCTYKCKTGYNANTFTSQECTVSGKYVFTQPPKACPAQCSQPNVTEATTIGNCSTGINSGTICKLGCTTGYIPALTGTLSITCINGSWSKPSGSCVAITCATPPPLHASLQIQSGTCNGSYNSICNYTCAYGYSLRDPQMSQKCTVNGSYVWSTPILPCFAQCPHRPGVPPQYQFPASNWSIYPVDSGYNGAYVCNSGTEATTPPSTFISTCMNGTWSNTTGVCTPITCKLPDDFASRNITIYNRCGGTYASLCDVRCTNPGFKTTTYTSNACLVSGDYQWDSFTDCEPITCVHDFDSSWIPTPETCDGSYNSTCHLTCAPNYVPGEWITTTPCGNSGRYSFKYVSGTYKDVDPSGPCRLTTKLYFYYGHIIPVDGFATPFATLQSTSVTAADNYCDNISCNFFTQLAIAGGQNIFSFYNVPIGSGNTVAANSSWTLYSNP